MNPNIYYIVESQFWRRSIGNILDNLIIGTKYDDALAKTKVIFTDDSPINARERAFSHFFSIIDVLSDGLGKKYTTDAQARIDLQRYFDSNNAVELMSSNQNKKFKVTDDIFNGIEIYMIIDKPLDNSKDNQGQKVLIHGIRYVDYPERLDEDLIATLEGLAKEYKYYDQNSFSFKNYFSLLDLSRIGGTLGYILKTPFDWDNLMKKLDGRKLIMKDSM